MPYRSFKKHNFGNVLPQIELKLYKAPNGLGG